ncbi:MAG: pseudouridine synthase, partial [Planctomycetes bacterium]|nr:pseudouridine synthase [Planctomycetota bacterium]
GKETDTYDATGKVTKRYDCKKLSLKEIRQAVSGFLGKQKQIPPMFSAKKVGGKKLYELARKNIVIERKASEIEIYKITILSYKWPLLSLRIYSSSGTYIRSIAYDLGRKLNCGAYLKALKRTKIGKYSLKKSHSIGKLKPNNWEKYLFLLK